MLIIIYVLIFILVVIIFQYRSPYIEYFVPIRDQLPDLYPSTAPVDMLTMKKFLLADGYRFQNTLFPPTEINNSCGPSGSKVLNSVCNLIGTSEFPDSFRQRTGAFKFKTYIENFQSGSGGGASIGTMSQLKSKDVFLKFLLVSWEQMHQPMM